MKTIPHASLSNELYQQFFSQLQQQPPEGTLSPAGQLHAALHPNPLSDDGVVASAVHYLVDGDDGAVPIGFIYVVHAVDSVASQDIISVEFVYIVQTHRLKNHSQLLMDAAIAFAEPVIRETAARGSDWELAIGGAPLSSAGWKFQNTFVADLCRIAKQNGVKVASDWKG